MKVQRTAYLHIRFDWLFSIYIVFAVAAIVRYLWIGWRALLRGDAPPAPDPTGHVGPMNLASPFSICDRRHHRRSRSSGCRSATR